MILDRRLALSASLLAVLALAASGCPKDDGNTAATPVPSPTATAGAVTTATPDGGATPEPTTTGGTAAADGAMWNVTYRWSGGLSIYQWYELSIAGADTAKVVFKVKPLKQEEVTVEDTLSKDELAELKGLFAMVKFDEVKTEPRKVRVMDIGQTVLTREIEGGTKHEVTESPAQKATTDIKPLRQWLDQRVRTYLDEAGVSPKRKPTPEASPTAKP